jgi:hypothetical protein
MPDRAGQSGEAKRGAASPKVRRGAFHRLTNRGAFGFATSHAHGPCSGQRTTTDCARYPACAGCNGVTPSSIFRRGLLFDHFPQRGGSACFKVCAAAVDDGDLAAAEREFLGLDYGDPIRERPFAECFLAEPEGDAPGGRCCTRRKCAAGKNHRVDLRSRLVN